MGCGSSKEDTADPIDVTIFIIFIQDLKIIKQQEDSTKGPPTFKVVCLGDKAVGKSWQDYPIYFYSIVARYTQDKFNETHAPTIGYAFISRDLIVCKNEGTEIPIKYKYIIKIYKIDYTYGILLEKKLINQ